MIVSNSDLNTAVVDLPTTVSIAAFLAIQNHKPSYDNFLAATGGTHVGQVGDEPVVRGQEGAQADYPQAQGPQ